MGWFKKFLKGLRIKKLDHGAGIGWSSGGMFDPTYQERTTPIEDFIDKESKENDEKLKKAFKPVKIEEE